MEMWLRLMRQYPVGILNERLMRYRRSRSQWSQQWRRLRTESNPEFDVMEAYLEKDGWHDKLRPADLIEYRFRQCDDQPRGRRILSFTEKRAGRASCCATIIHFCTLLNSIRRRKLRVLLLRGIMKSALGFRAERLLARLLVQTEYGGQFS
jgi:hypothetical protein